MTSPRASMLALAKLIAKDMTKGGHVDTRGLAPALAADIDAVMAVLDLLVAEVGRKRPRNSLVAALAKLVETALNETRMLNEERQRQSKLAERIRESLAAGIAAGRVAPEALMLVAQCFAAAKLDIGDALRAEMIGLAADRGGDGSGEPPDLTANLHELAAMVRDDPVALHGQLTEQLAVFPDEHRLAIVEAMIGADAPTLRDAALGWVLDPNPAIAHAVAEMLVQAARRGSVSALSLARLVTMRGWLAADLRAVVDQAVRAGRARGEAPVAPDAPVQIADVLGSGCDGAGAQTFFVVTRQGRSYALASLLIKHGFGVRDAWRRTGLGKAEIGAFLREITLELDPYDCSIEIIQHAIANALAIGQEQGTPPPFGLLPFVEAAGLGMIQPARVAEEALLAELLDDLPPVVTGPTAVAAALRWSKRWPRLFVWLDSWFADVTGVAAELTAVRTPTQRRDIVLARVVEPNRRQWASRLAWTAATARDSDADPGGVRLALVAREMAGDRPLREIPIASWIASHSVEVAAAKDFDGDGPDGPDRRD